MTGHGHAQGIDTRLLLIGGAGIALVYLLMNKQTTPAASDTSGGAAGGFDLGSILGGLGSPAEGGSGAPTIYQFPPDAQVNFPQNGGGLDLAGLMALLGAGTPPPDAITKTTAKKDAIIDADPGGAGKIKVLPQGSTWGSGELPANLDTTPFDMTKYQTKKAAVPGTDGGSILDRLVGLWPYAAAVPLGPLALAPIATASALSWASQLLGEFPAAARAVNLDLMNQGNGGLAATVPTKKESSVFGYSGQYGLDPVTGALVWTDPVIAKFQGDIFIGSRLGTLYNPVTRSGNAATVVAANSNPATFGYSRDLDSKEYQKAYYQSVVAGNVLAAGGTPAPYYSDESKKIVAPYATMSPSMPGNSLPAPFVTAGKKTVSSSLTSAPASSGSKMSGGWGGGSYTTGSASARNSSAGW